MEVNDKKFETRPMLYIWGGLGCICLAGVIFAGAWWHLFTVALCGLMFMAFLTDDDEQ